MLVSVGDEVSLGDAQLAQASRGDVMTWSWVSNWVVGASVKSYVIVVITWRMQYYGFTTGVVVVWWQNSTVS